MNLFQHIKIAPFVLLISACTIDADPESEATNSSGGNNNSILSADTATGSQDSAGATNAQTSEDLSGTQSATGANGVLNDGVNTDVSNNLLNALSNSVGGVLSSETQTGVTVPDITEQPSVAEQPDSVGQPVASEQPGPVDQPVSTDQPNEVNQPSGVDQSVTTNQPNEVNQPSGVDQPVDTDQPNEVNQPSGVDQTNITDQPNAVDQPDSTDEPAATDQPGLTPSAEGTPADDAPTMTPPADNGVDTQGEEAIPEPPAENPIVRIPLTDRPNAPKIDGDTLEYIGGTELLDGEWRFAAQFNGAGEPLSVGQHMFGEPGTNNEDAKHHWAAIHDGEFLYLLVVSDDAGEHFQDTEEARKPWKDDSIEVFIDGNNSQLTEYDGVDDFHMTINLFSSTDVVNHSYNGDPKIRQSENSATLPSDLIFAAGPRKGPVAANIERGRKDIYEIRIKLSELNIQVDSPFGIEVQINDDDNGGSRDSKWGWNHPEGNNSENDNTWQNPSFMGTAILLQ